MHNWERIHSFFKLLLPVFQVNLSKVRNLTSVECKANRIHVPPASWDAGRASAQVAKPLSYLEAHRKWAVLVPTVGAKGALFSAHILCTVNQERLTWASCGAQERLPLSAKEVKFLCRCKDVLLGAREWLLSNKTRILSRSKNILRFPEFYSPSACCSISAIWAPSSVTSTPSYPCFHHYWIAPTVYGLYAFAGAAVAKYHRLGSLTTEIYFLTILEAGTLRWRLWQGGFLLRPRSLACRWPSSLCVFTVFPPCVSVS